MNRGQCTRCLVLYFQTGATLRCHFLRVVAAATFFRPCRCGDFGMVSRHRPAEHHFLMFPQFPTLRRRASRAVAVAVSFSCRPRCCGGDSARCCGTGKLWSTFPFCTCFNHSSHAMRRWRKGSSRLLRRGQTEPGTSGLQVTKKGVGSASTLAVHSFSFRQYHDVHCRISRAPHWKGRAGYDLQDRVFSVYESG